MGVRGERSEEGEEEEDEEGEEEGSGGVSGRLMANLAQQQYKLPVCWYSIHTRCVQCRQYINPRSRNNSVDETQAESLRFGQQRHCCWAGWVLGWRFQLVLLEDNGCDQSSTAAPVHPRPCPRPLLPPPSPQPEHASSTQWPIDSHRRELASLPAAEAG